MKKRNKNEIYYGILIVLTVVILIAGFIYWRSSAASARQSKVQAETLGKERMALITVLDEKSILKAVRANKEIALDRNKYCLQSEDFEQAQKELWKLLRGLDTGGDFKFNLLPREEGRSSYVHVSVELASSDNKSSGGVALKNVVEFLHRLESQEIFLRVDSLRIQPIAQRNSDRVSCSLQVTGLMKIAGDTGQ